MSTLAYFPIDLSCEDYSFLDRTVEKSDYGLDSIFIKSIDTLELDVSFDEPDAIASLVFAGFLHSISTLSDSSKLQFVPSFKSCILLYQDRALTFACFIGGQNVSI